MKKNLWMILPLSLAVVLATLFVGASLAFAQATTAPAPGAPVEQANKLLAFLLASGWAGGLWKGAAVGALRSVIGFWSKDPEHPSAEPWDWSKLVTAGLLGGGVGLVAGYMKMPFDTVSGWAASFGATEVIYRVVQAVWRRIARPAATNIVAKAILKKDKMLAAEKAAPTK